MSLESTALYYDSISTQRHNKHNIALSLTGRTETYDGGECEEIAPLAPGPAYAQHRRTNFESMILSKISSMHDIILQPGETPKAMPIEEIVFMGK